MPGFSQLLCSPVSSLNIINTDDICFSIRENAVYQNKWNLMFVKILNFLATVLYRNNDKAVDLPVYHCVNKLTKPRRILSRTSNKHDKVMFLTFRLDCARYATGKPVFDIRHNKSNSICFFCL